MPLRCRADAEVKDDGHGDPARVLFRAVPVLDRSQVDARDDREPAPLEPPSQPLTGDSHAALLEPATAFAASLGYDVAYERTPSGVGAGATTSDGGSSSTPTPQPTRNYESPSTRPRTRSASTTRAIRANAPK
jgi:hypothetical protein